jgi:predicted HTH transcriptional regulator
MKDKPVPPPDLWEALDREVAETFTPAPPGSFTYKSYAARYGLSRMCATNQVKKLVEKGVVVCLGQYGGKGEWHFILAGVK